MKNNDLCISSLQQDGRHRFEFGKPIRKAKTGKEASANKVKVQEGKITFQ
jgi:hypothetical protein